MTLPIPADTIAEIRRLLADGMPRRRIADRLGVSYGAVQHYGAGMRRAGHRFEISGGGTRQLVSDAEMARAYAGRRYQDVRFRR